MPDRNKWKGIRDKGWGMTPTQVENFYYRWREWMLVAARRDAVVVANPSHRGFMEDLLERLKEDPWFTLQIPGDVVMYFDDAVPYDDLMFSVAGRGLLTPAQLIGANAGFGRMNAKAPSRDGVMPWSEATPDADAHPVQPDTEEPDDTKP